MQSDPWHLWAGNPMMILGQVLERTEAANDAIADLRGDVTVIKDRLTDGHHRMSKIETQMKSPEQKRLHWLAAFLREVATAREWLTGAALVVLALKGVFSPAEIKAILLTMFGAGPP